MAELFNSIESVQPLVAEDNPTWWSRFQSFDDLNNFLSNPEFNLGSVIIQCGAQGGCVGTCMCECYEEAGCGNVCDVVFGCTDPNASNYNPEATSGNPCSRWVGDDGSSVYTALALHVFSEFWFGDEVTPECGCVYDVGCTNPAAENFDTNITNILGELSIDAQELTDDIYLSYGVSFSDFCGDVSEGLFDTPDYTPLQYFLECVVETGIFNSNEECGEVIPGCTNETANNYNPDATYNDGSCIIPGCTQDNVAWSTSISYPPGAGYSQNYNPDATEDDGSCIFPEVCCDPDATNVITSTTFANGYQLCDSIDNAQVYYGTNYVGYPSNNDLCEYPEDYFGCTDEDATNYSSNAVEDDDSCEYAENQVCPESGTIMPASCFAEVDQSEDSIQWMIVNIVNSSQFEQQWCGQGCVNGDLVNDPYYGACDCCCPEWLNQIEGCTDEEANNFDPTADIDDGSCEYPSCFKFNSLEPDQQVDLCSAYFEMIDGGQQFDPNLNEWTEEGACCKEIIIEPTKEGYNCRSGFGGDPNASKCVPCGPTGPCSYSSEEECINAGCEEQQNVKLGRTKPLKESVIKRFKKLAGIKSKK